MEVMGMNLIRRFDGPDLRRGIFNCDFADMYKSLEEAGLATLTPAVDILEEKDKYIVKADLPGLKQDAVKIEYAENILTISGEKKQETSETAGDRHYFERSFGNFERRINLPAGTEADKIKAKMDNGVLTVEIPKAEEKKPKEIKVE
jgi:HSP20 family protein